MSNPGIPNQTIQNQMQQQKLAQMLQGGMSAQAPAQANPTTPYAGVANAGNSVLQALQMNNLTQQQNNPENQVVQQRYGMTPQQAQNVLSPSWGSQAKNWVGNQVNSLFGMGGG